MAEHFVGRKRTIHTTNGGGEALLKLLTSVGSHIAATPDEEAVVAFLKLRLNKGSGWRAFSLDPPGPELAATERLRALARITAEAARRLAHPQGPLDPSLSAAQEELRLLYLAMVVILYDMIGDELPPEAPLAPPALGLSPEEQRELDIWHIQVEWADVKRREGPEGVLVMLDRLAALVEAAEPTLANRERLMHCHEGRYDQFKELEDVPNQIAALQQVAALAADEEYRRAAESVIEDLRAAAKRPRPWWRRLF
jgi:hypothetical protein